MADELGENEVSPWDWCFGSMWSDVDNTVHGAADRIEYMMTHGVPDNGDEQRYGEAPLSYRPEPVK